MLDQGCLKGVDTARGTFAASDISSDIALAKPANHGEKLKGKEIAVHG